MLVANDLHLQLFFVMHTGKKSQQCRISFKRSYWCRRILC